MKYLLDTNICIYIIKKKPLVTNNVREFKRVPQLEIVNWAE